MTSHTLLTDWTNQEKTDNFAYIFVIYYSCFTL